MSRVTRTKLYRRFEIGKDNQPIDREKVLPPFENGHKPCAICGGKMIVTAGQVMKQHKICKKNRKRFNI